MDGSYAYAASYAPRLGYDRVAGIIEENGGDPAKIKAALEAEAEKREPAPPAPS